MATVHLSGVRCEASAVSARLSAVIMIDAASFLGFTESRGAGGGEREEEEGEKGGVVVQTRVFPAFLSRRA